MELFERVKELATVHFGSVAKLAARIGIAQTTFNAYLKPERQHNLWPLLPKILDAAPEISRQWLYFAEGEMFAEEKPGTSCSGEGIQAKLYRLEELEAQVKSLETEKIRLMEELIAAQRKNMTLLEERGRTARKGAAIPASGEIREAEGNYGGAPLQEGTGEYPLRGRESTD